MNNSYHIYAQHNGNTQPQWVINFRGKQLPDMYFDTEGGAITAAQDHNALRQINLVYPLICGLLEQHQPTSNSQTYKQVVKRLTDLCKHINQVSPDKGEEIWWIDTPMSIGIDELIIGAYWFYQERQTDHQELYNLLSGIYTPNMDTDEEVQHVIKAFEEIVQ